MTEMTEPRRGFAYRGTDIDGVSIDPDRLEIRGRSITEVIGALSLCEAALFTLDVDRGAAAALDAGLAQVVAACGPDHPGPRIAALAAGAGADLPRAVMAGLCALGEAEAATLREAVPSLPGGAVEGLSVCAAVPALIAAWGAARGRPAGRTREARFVTLARDLCAEGAACAPADLALFEDVLVGWIGGFGPLPPSVMIPRIAVGTGVSIQQAVTAAFAAAGPLHIGATMQAVAILNRALDAQAETPVGAMLDRMLASGQKIGGFGHPLLNRDPRPPHLRARARGMGSAHPVWELYDAACAHMAATTGLEPNVDFSCGAAMIAAGVRDPAAAAGLAMMARGIGITAHVLERRARPAFGIRRQMARDHLETFPEGWL